MSIFFWLTLYLILDKCWILLYIDNYHVKSGYQLYGNYSKSYASTLILYQWYSAQVFIPFHSATQQHTHNHFTALWILSGTTRVSRYQKKHSPTYTYRGHQSSLICFIHLLRSMTSSLFNPRTWQSFSTISLQVFFGLPNTANVYWNICHSKVTHLKTYFGNNIQRRLYFNAKQWHTPSFTIRVPRITLDFFGWGGPTHTITTYISPIRDNNMSNSMISGHPSQ